MHACVFMYTLVSLLNLRASPWGKATISSKKTHNFLRKTDIFFEKDRIFGPVLMKIQSCRNLWAVTHLCLEHVFFKRYNLSYLLFLTIQPESFACFLNIPVILWPFLDQRTYLWRRLYGVYYVCGLLSTKANNFLAEHVHAYASKQAHACNMLIYTPMLCVDCSKWDTSITSNAVVFTFLSRNRWLLICVPSWHVNMTCAPMLAWTAANGTYQSAWIV